MMATVIDDRPDYYDNRIEFQGEDPAGQGTVLSLPISGILYYRMSSKGILVSHSRMYRTSLTLEIRSKHVS